MDERERLGRGAVTCPGWRWMPGMIGVDPAGARCRILTVADDGGVVEWAFLTSRDDRRLAKVVTAWGSPGWSADVWAVATPDLTDPATVGCLLALVREAWGESTAHVASDTTRGVAAWQIVTFGGRRLGGLYITARTEAAALVAALKSAGQRTP